MKVSLKHPAHLCGVDYKKGIHEMSEEVLKDPNFIRMAKAGLIVDPAAQQVVSALPLDEKKQAFVDAILNSVKKPEAPKSDEAPVLPDGDELVGKAHSEAEKLGMEDSNKDELPPLGDEEQSEEAMDDESDEPEMKEKAYSPKTKLKKKR